MIGNKVSEMGSIPGLFSVTRSIPAYFQIITNLPVDFPTYLVGVWREAM